jgi:ubiquinone/menaquinone biosynthesis C-methylase UbiE
MADERVRAERAAELQAERADALRARLDRILPLTGEERVLDVGTGTGAVALALAPLVREVIGLDESEERLALASERAPENVTFVVGDASSLPFGIGEFDFVTSVRTLHHVRRPEVVIAELVRVTRLGGHLLVVDQLAPVEPLEALELDRFERARDPSHNRLLMDGDLRAMFEMNGLVTLVNEVVRERRDVDRYLDLAACEGDARTHAESLAPGETSEVDVGWYVLRR